MTVTRRGVLGAIPASLFASDRSQGKDPPLKSIAERANLFFGAAIDDAVFRDEAFKALVCDQCGVATPETAFKFAVFQREQGRTDFGPADRMLQFARANALQLRGTTLIWNDDIPAWVRRLSRAELRHAFDSFLDTVVPRYAGQLQSWDVVNEPFYLGRDRPGAFRPGPWLDAFGEDYISRAFQRVAALDPTTPLVLNEAWTERSDAIGLAVRRALLILVERLKDKGVRLDAVGLQGHLFPREPYDDAGFLDFLHALAARKVDIFITEMDVVDAGLPNDVALRDRLIARRTQDFLSTVLREPAVKGVVLWGLSDRYTWQREPRVVRGMGTSPIARPLPYDDALNPKPMRAALVEAMQGRRV